MGDTGAQIRQWFNYPNGTRGLPASAQSPMCYSTDITPWCTRLSSVRASSWGFHCSTAPTQVLPSTLALSSSLRLPCMAYSISSLRKLGVSLPVRGAILLFFAFMPMFSNYAALLTKRRAVCRRVFSAVGADREALWPAACPVAMPMPSVRANQRPVLFGAPRLAAASLWAPWVPRFCATAAWCSPGGMRNRGGVLRMGRACGSSCSQADW